MSFPVAKLEDARVDQFSWYFEDEELEFIRSHKASFFEKKEAERFSKYLDGITASTWWLRKRELDRIEDKENTPIKNEYFNAMGMPAPAPWQNEKRIKIEVPEHERIPPAVGRGQFKRISQEIIGLSKKLDEKVSICVLTRTETNVPSNIICSYFDHNLKKRVISSVQVFNYGHNHTLGLELHIPSKFSIDSVLEEASLMIQDENPSLDRQYTAIYSPVIKTASAKLNLDWTISQNHQGPERDPNMLSGPDFGDEKSFQASIKIRPELGLDFPDEFKDLRADIDQLKIFLEAMSTENLPKSSKLSVDLHSIIRGSTNVEISDLVWSSCKYSSLQEITKNLTTLITFATQGDATNISVFSDNDSDFAMKFIKARKRGIPSKIHESSALEMIFECGEQAISRKLDECISSRAGLAQLLGSPNGSQRVQEQLQELVRRLEAICLHHGLQTLALPEATIRSFISDWVAQGGGEVTQTVSGFSAYKIVKEHRPTSWSMKMDQYMIDIICKEDHADQKSEYFVYEKTTNFADI